MRIQIHSDPLPAPEERRRLREAAGLTGVNLAAAIGVSPASVYAWETGARTPTGLQRTAYLKALQRIVTQLEERGAGHDV
jgi:DNA-binding transcriptional regulator YiaG